MQDPSTGCQISNTSLHRRWCLCPTEKSENTAFPLVVIGTALATNASFLRSGQVDPLFLLFPRSPVCLKMGRRENRTPSYLSTVYERLWSLTSIRHSSWAPPFEAMGERKSNYFTGVHRRQLLKGLLLVQDGERNQRELAPPHTVPAKTLCGELTLYL